jgi:hypothetical protein
MPIITIRIMGGANMLKTKGLVLESMCMSHIRVCRQMELPIVSISMVGAKGSKLVHIVGPGPHKAIQAKGFRGKMWKDIKWVSRNNIRELRHNSEGRWGCIPSLGGRIGIRRSRRKSRGRVRM